MTRRLLLLALDVAVWAFAFWLLTAPAGTVAPQVWHSTARTCRCLAHAFGRCAIEAEKHYWKAVQP